MWGYFVSVREKTFRYRRGSFLQKELIFKEAVYESSFHFHAQNLVVYPVIFLETEILMTIHYVHCSGTWDSTKTLSRENTSIIQYFPAELRDKQAISLVVTWHISSSILNSPEWCKINDIKDDKRWQKITTARASFARKFKLELAQKYMLLSITWLGTCIISWKDIEKSDLLV